MPVEEEFHLIYYHPLLNIMFFMPRQKKISHLSSLQKL